MSKFRKKPVVIEAWRIENIPRVPPWSFHGLSARMLPLWVRAAYAASYEPVD